MSIILKSQAKETSFTHVCKKDAEISQDFRQFGNIYIYINVCIHVYILLDSRETIVQFPCFVFYWIALRKLMS